MKGYYKKIIPFLMVDVLRRKLVLSHTYIKTSIRRGILAISRDGIYIQTISGGIVNFGGAVTIAPISITKGSSGSGSSNTGSKVTENPGMILNRFTSLAESLAGGSGSGTRR
jgi:hypothetical protein